MKQPDIQQEIRQVMTRARPRNYFSEEDETKMFILVGSAIALAELVLAGDKRGADYQSKRIRSLAAEDPDFAKRYRDAQSMVIEEVHTLLAERRPREGN